MDPKKVYIFHITHIENLPRIMAAGGLRCDRLRVQNGEAVMGIAHQRIKDRRAKRPVFVAAKGTLADYVPFYFAPRSPMLYTIHGGNVDGYTGGQKPIVHLVSTVDTAVALGKPWCFTDGHADMAFSNYSDDLKNLDKVDWTVMKSKFWNDTDLAPDRKRRRQAEFLVHESFPWTAILGIGVLDGEIKTRVTQILAENTHRPPVAVKGSWYY